jgi:hypothetical protein
VTALTEFRSALLINPTWSTDGKRLLVTARGKDNRAWSKSIWPAVARRAISKPGEEVLSGTYGADPDSYLLVLGGSGHQNELVLLEHFGTR